MAKEKRIFECSNCHYVSFKWLGSCPQCEEWNTFAESYSSPLPRQTRPGGVTRTPVAVTKLDEIAPINDDRISTGIDEWDRVMGGGLVPGSFIIVTGDPGIGKSTLLLQIADRLAHHKKVMYFSSEESLAQVKKRAIRLGIAHSAVLFADQTNLDLIVNAGIEHKPDVIILDSIQNCSTSSDTHAIPGSITHLKEAGFVLMKLAKEHMIAVIITGHITKEGHMAGPKVLEHMVDGVFYLQAADQWQIRLLRAVKNRFGTIDELGFFQMEENGLVQIQDINHFLIGEPTASCGSVLACEVEGSRPLLLEIQALCVTSKFGMPQRVVTGVDPKRVMLIAAILEKYLHVQLSGQDIFFKVAGGVKLKESASDMSIALALLSSYFQQPLPLHSLALAEISLSGTIKPINYCSLRLKEAEKFGLTTIMLAHDQKIPHKNAMSFKTVYELLKLFPEK